jgi:hypothetical protein
MAQSAMCAPAALLTPLARRGASHLKDGEDLEDTSTLPENIAGTRELMTQPVAAEPDEALDEPPAEARMGLEYGPSLLVFSETEIPGSPD